MYHNHEASYNHYQLFRLRLVEEFVDYDNKEEWSTEHEHSA
jgi:hypothetical protein